MSILHIEWGKEYKRNMKHVIWYVYLIFLSFSPHYIYMCVYIPYFYLFVFKFTFYISYFIQIRYRESLFYRTFVKGHASSHS